MGLLRKRNEELNMNTNRINYSYLPSVNKFCLNKFTDSSDIRKDPNNINIVVDPHKFNEKNPIELLERVNKKWFINLSNSKIPREVCSLLQYGDRFCLPILNKKLAIHEFIKDIESNMYLHTNNNKIMIRNTAIPQLHKFLHNAPSINMLDMKLIHMKKATEEFCKNNKNIIFTRADKGNITVAMEKTYYINKIEELLKDSNTYTVVKKIPAKNIEYKLNNILKNGCNMNTLPNNNFLSSVPVMPFYLKHTASLRSTKLILHLESSFLL